MPKHLSKKLIFCLNFFLKSLNMGELFIDKYSPQTFSDVCFNYKMADQLQHCAQATNMPHIIIHGPSGCGKKTFAELYIKEKYHLKTLNTRQEMIEVKYANKSIDMQLLYSNHHYMIDPSIHGVYDRLIIQGFFKDILQIRPIAEIDYQLIIIKNADQLTNEAQQSLRRTLEKYVSNCQFIFLIKQNSTLINPLISRCIQFRLSAPTNDEITNILTFICQQENISAHCEQLNQISHYSDRNLNQAINVLQYLSIHNPQILASRDGDGGGDISFLDYIEVDQYINQIIEMIDQNYNDITIIQQIRFKLYDLLCHCVEPIIILKKIFKGLFSKGHNQYQLIEYLNKYENSLKLGSKPIYHLEGFIISVLNFKT